MDFKDWTLPGFGQKEDKWPRDAAGEPEEPVFLEHITGTELDVKMAVSLLVSFGIPVLYKYPNDGEFGKLLFGFAGPGVDVYVPASRLEDARGLLSAEILEEDEEESQP